jgi:hypothetical protein
MRRSIGLDVLRGVGIVGVLFLHFALYRFGGLMDIDFSDPPPLVTAIGFALMWAGLFAVASGAAMAARSMERSETGGPVLRPALARALVMLVLSYLYFLVFGPGLVHFDSKSIDYGILPSLANFGELRWPTAERLLYVDSLGMIALNAAVVGVAMKAVLRRGNGAGLGAWAALFASACAALALGLFRIPLYELFARGFESGETWTLVGLNFLANKNNPLLPYAAFGLFGASAAVAAKLRSRLALGIGYVAGAAMSVGGMALYLVWPDTMLERAIDETWFLLMAFQCGAFLLIVQAILHVSAARRGGARQASPAAPARALSLYGRAGLTAFMLEPLATAAIGRALDALLPGWNATMPGTMAVAALYAAAWGGALLAWKRARFAFGADWLYAKGCELLGYPSTRLDFPEKGA